MVPQRRVLRRVSREAEDNMHLKNLFRPMPWPQSIAFSVACGVIVFVVIYYFG
jgi:hypothetical protein